MIKYDFTANPWQVVERNFPKTRDAHQKLSYLLRYAILAPSSHNTQPWKFSVHHDEIRVFANADRWLNVADADQRELHISVGCALENLLVAAEHFAYDCNVRYFPEPSNPRCVASVTLKPGDKPSRGAGGELFDAILTRHTNHKVYESRPVPSEDQQRLEACCSEKGLSLYLTSDMSIKRKVDGLVNRADAIQFADTRFREELGYWIGQGVFGAPWLFAKLSQLAVSYLDVGSWVAKKDSEVLMSAPVLGIICSESNDRESQVKVGQVFGRIYLTASALGLSLQPMSQIVEVAEIKAEVGRLIPAEGSFPQQPFRLGYAEPEKEHTPRRPVEEVMA